MDLAFIPSPSVSEWQLGPFTLRAYALSIMVGIVAAVWITEARLRSRGAPKWATLDVAVWAVPFGIIGARLYHVFTTPQPYFGENGDPAKIIAIWEGGLGIPGAVLVGALGAYIACRKMNLPFPMLADAIAPGLPVAQALGRFGNWFNQELYGKPTEVWWALEIDEAYREPGYFQYATYHPTFLYEALWNVGVAVAVWAADRRFKFGAGRAFALYVLLYGVGRYWVEGLRIDHAEVFLGLRLNQWTSILIVLGALVYLWFKRGDERRVFTAVDGRRVLTDWNSADAKECGYVSGRLPRGVHLPLDDEAPAHKPEDAEESGEKTAEPETKPAEKRDRDRKRDRGLDY
ncbi:prolipoprotein diacylglyceryl transferase [Salininema proteolyticum]|uniref:Phosphatidylglycerol--prolipoprotein diacylglyceryl transferase n=1 Tax=Salininema proteolyticum TaxID=1607685 RepID=A0ABV8TXM6_9ACTN